MVLLPPLFIVSVSCLLVLSAATLRQKPANSKLTQGEQSAALTVNSLPSGTLLPPFPPPSLPFRGEEAEIVLK